MKIKHLIFSFLFIFILLSGIVHANILVKFTNGDQCNQVEGVWSGEGTIETVCKYKGTATIRKGGAPTQYSVEVNLAHDSWYFWCPDPKTFTVPATCTGSTFDISTQNGTHLSGETDGHTTNLSGQIVVGSSKVDVNSLKLTKN